MSVAGAKKLLALVGPTAVGKTEYSLRIAERFDCEIISGDSIQVYRGMDIGTAKASAAERARVPHHLIDILEPDQPFSVSDFKRLAERAIEDIHSRGKLPFIVGGTGLYVESVCYDFRFDEGGIDLDFRREQAEYAEQYGAEALHDKLKQVDPITAERLHPNDRKRIIRALEMVHLSGTRMSDHLSAQSGVSPYDLCLIGLTMDRGSLYERIEQRVDRMMEQGLIDEVRQLLDRGFHRGMTSMQGLGYKEIAAYLEGETTLEQAVALLKRDTRRFAKRQLSWFRHMRDIHWIDLSKDEIFYAHSGPINDIIAGKFY